MAESHSALLLIPCPRIAFGYEPSGGMEIVVSIVDSYFIIDILFSFLTGFVDGGCAVMIPGRICHNYVERGGSSHDDYLARCCHLLIGPKAISIALTLIQRHRIQFTFQCDIKPTSIEGHYILERRVFEHGIQ